MRNGDDGAVHGVYARDNADHTDVLAGLAPLFVRLVLAMLRPGERISDAFAYHADYLDVTNPFRPRPRFRPALACLTRTRLIEVYAARGGLTVVPSAEWVVRHAADAEFGAVDLADVATVSTRRGMRRSGVANDVVLELSDGRQYRIGPHTDSTRAEIIADRVRQRMSTGNRSTSTGDH